jgi:hypothetical protein
MIDKSKETYQQYRERARELYGTCAVYHAAQHGRNLLVEEITVPLQANVQICEGGAFVEAIVWVPESKLQRPEPLHAAGEFVMIHELADVDPGDLKVALEFAHAELDAPRIRMGADEELPPPAATDLSNEVAELYINLWCDTHNKRLAEIEAYANPFANFRRACLLKEIAEAAGPLDDFDDDACDPFDDYY